MECKKIVGCTLVIGSIWALYNISQNNFMVSCIKRKGKQLTKKMEDFFNNLDENGLKKYKEKLVDDFNNLKQKIDNLTIKDIKNAGSEMIEGILDSIESLKMNVLTSS